LLRGQAGGSVLQLMAGPAHSVTNPNSLKQAEA
jgi:hypothetical protein